MELMTAEKPLEFTQADVTFLVKPRATAADKFAVVMCATTAEFMRTAIRQMVTGWRGVTSEGKPIAYSPDMLDRLPSTKENILLSLGNFVISNTDIVKEESEAKNV